MAIADIANGPEVRQRDRLTAARIVGDRDHDERHAIGTHLFDGALEALDVHVALEGMEHGRVAACGDDEVSRLGTLVFDVGASRVEMGVVGHDVAL